MTWRRPAFIMATCHEMIGKNTGTSTAPTAETHWSTRTRICALSPTVATREARDFVEWLEPSVSIHCLPSAFSYTFLSCTLKLSCGPGSVVGIATGYGLDGPGIESWWGRDFPHLSRPILEPTQPPVKWVPGLSRGIEATGADPPPHLVPRS